MRLLHIDSSPLGAHSVTREMTADVVAAYRVKNEGVTVIRRDLAVTAPDHLSAEILPAATANSNLTGRQRDQLALTEELLQEFLAADVIVIGAPMYNFSVPTQLKAWIDRIAQAGRTFHYTENGPVGLAGGKQVVIASSRGGFYSADVAMQALDHQESYLRTVLGFLGITDVTVVRAEGVAMGRADAVAQAKAQIANVVEREAA